MWWENRRCRKNKYGVNPSDFDSYEKYRRACKSASDREHMKERYDANPEKFRERQRVYHDKTKDVRKQRRIDAWGDIDSQGGGSKCERYTFMLLKEFFPKAKIERQYYIRLDAEEKLVSKRKRIFVDFYIPSLRLMVEYNGSQHYREGNTYFDKFSGSIAGYLDTMLTRDKFLDDWCKKKGITLIIVDGRVAQRPHQIKDYLYPLLENRRRITAP